MSRATDAILAYGYLLGSDDHEWQVREADQYGALTLDWYQPEHDDEPDFEAAATGELLAANGFTEEYDGTPAWWDRRRDAFGALPARIVTFCSDADPKFLIAATILDARLGGWPQDATSLLATGDQARAQWDRNLSAALSTLGLTPVQERPAWLLCSYTDGAIDDA